MIDDFSTFLDDSWSSTTTGAGSTTTLVDTALGRFGDDRLIGMFIRITEDVNGNQWAIRRITDFVGSTGTVTVRPAFSGSTGSGTDYELHRYDPALKFKALDEARIEAVDDLYQLVYDESITTDGQNNVFNIPSSIRLGPIAVQIEDPIPVEVDYNFIQDPKGDSTDNWTAASLTASTVDRDQTDLLVPKYTETATKMVVAGSTNGTYKQTVANMTNSITAAKAADRGMAFGAWVYCTEASRVTLTLEDDNGETSSSAHGGAGWEFLTLSKTIDGDNATTLTAGFDVSSDTAPVTAYWQNAILMYGDKVPSYYPADTFYKVRRDDTTQTFTIPQRKITARRQLRLIGKDVLSALGTTAASQVTNTMELDAQNSRLLFAHAAEILFGWEGYRVADQPNILRRIQLTRERRDKLRNKWDQDLNYLRIWTPFD